MKPMRAMTPLFHITLPPLDEYSVEAHFAPLLGPLEGLIATNVIHLRLAMKRAEAGDGPMIPPLYQSGVRYEEDPPGHEDWRDCLQILQRGVADCDQLVGWRTAELRVAGIPAEPVIKWQHLPYDVAQALGFGNHGVTQDGLWIVHCCVRYPDGTIEDPSKILGMGAEFTNRV